MPINLSKNSDFFTAAESKNRRLVLFLSISGGDFNSSAPYNYYYCSLEQPVTLTSGQHMNTYRNTNISFEANGPFLEEIDVRERESDTGIRSATVTLGSSTVSDTDSVGYKLRSVRRGDKMQILFGYQKEDGTITDLVMPFFGEIGKVSRKIDDGRVLIQIEVRLGIAEPGQTNPVLLTETSEDDNTYAYSVRRVEGTWGA